MEASTMIVMIAMFVYLAGMVAIGIIFSKSSNSTEEFYLGGRKLGPLVTAMSAEASDMSSWLLMGLPGVALLAGLPEATWTAIGLGIGTYINWLVVAKRIRRYSQKLGAVTIPEYFSRRYHDDKHVLSLISALVIIVFFIPYVASGFNACGTLFSSLFNVSYLPSMLVAALVIMAYTSLGGFMAASTSDLIQSVVMTIALAIVVIFGVGVAGGMDAVAANAASMPGYLDLFRGYNAATGTADTYSGLTIASTLAWGLGYFGMPHILLRFMAIKDAAKLRTSRRIATVWVFLSMGVAILIGVVGNAVIAAGKVDALAASDSQRIIIRLAQLLGKEGVLPAIIAGVILSGILAATMSTADSQLLAAASSVTEDLMKETFGRQISKEAAMKIARLTVLAIAIVAAIWARKEGSVFTIVSFAWAGFGAAFGPTVLLSLFWKRSNRQGAICGMIAGGVMVFVWKYAVRPLGGILDIYELLPAFLIGLAVNIIVSLATAAPEQSIVDEFEAMQDAHRDL